MSILSWKKMKFYALTLGCSGLILAGMAQAQSTQVSQAGSANWSSSQTGQVQLAEGAAPANPAAAPANPSSASALPSAPAPAAQDNSGNYSGWHGHDIVHRLTIEVGGGASAPAGDKADITWGDGILLGAGVNINHNLATFIEYQFLDNKVPGLVIAESGAQGGRYHIWSFTLAPVYDMFPKSANDAYLVGGGGFYRKVMNFTDPTESCGFFYYYYTCGTSNQVVGHISSNQGGWNIGGGYQHRFGGMYGLSRTRFFAEVRYLEVLSPVIKSASANGLSPVNVSANTKLMPITVGIRW